MLHYWFDLICTLWFPMFFGIGQGPSQGQRNAANNINSISAFDTSTGENLIGTGVGDISNATNFWNSILSGDPAAISKVLSSQIGGIKSRAQEGIDTTSQFSNRGGGTNAAVQSTSDTVRGDINQMIGSLTGTAATEIGNLGTNLVSAGSNLTGQALQGDVASFGAQTTMHNENANMWNDIFKSIASVVSPFIPGAGAIGGSSSSAAAIDATVPYPSGPIDPGGDSGGIYY
jgi:hypothetical protein